MNGPEEGPVVGRMRVMSVEQARGVGDGSASSGPAATRDLRRAPEPIVALAVIAAPAGVLAGRRRDGVPLWVFLGGPIEPGELPAQAVARGCFEATGLTVRVEHQIDCRRRAIYLACTLTTATAVRAPRSPELVEELRWLDPDWVEDLMPALPSGVRNYLHLRYILRATRGRLR